MCHIQSIHVYKFNCIWSSISYIKHRKICLNKYNIKSDFIVKYCVGKTAISRHYQTVNGANHQQNQCFTVCWSEKYFVLMESTWFWSRALNLWSFMQLLNIIYFTKSTHVVNCHEITHMIIKYSVFVGILSMVKTYSKYATKYWKIQYY